MDVNEVLEEVIRICKEHSVREIYLYGSRAKGTHRERSDIDIAVSGAQDFGTLFWQVDEIPTLYTVDLLNLDTCRNRNLLEDIRLYGRKIYESVS